MPEPLQIGGRAFRIVEQSTVEHDNWLSRHLRAAEVTAARQRDGETREQFVVRLHEQILDSGQMLPLLAGILLPAELEDLAWTPAVAKETQEFLSKLFAPEDKRAMHTALASFSGFFAAGLLLRELSPGASKAETPSAPQQPAANEPATDSAG